MGKKKVAPEPAKKGTGKTPPAGVDELDTWMEKYLAPRYITIADIKRMKAGEKLKVLSLDRNWEDLCLYEGNRNFAEIPEFKSLRPEKLFRPSLATYRHGSALQGTLEFAGLEGIADDFIFELEFEKGNWYPLYEDEKTGTLTLPNKDHLKPYGGKVWTKFATSTHVGFRGPMVAWSHLAKLPPLWCALSMTKVREEG